MRRRENQPRRSVSIAGNAIGSVIQTGDKNVASLRFTRTTLPPPESVDMKAELDELRQLLGQLRSPDGNKMNRAIEDAQEELGKPQVDRDEIGDALDRVMKYARKAEGFADIAAKLKPHVVNIVSWLGRNWEKLLSVVGLAV